MRASREAHDEPRRRHLHSRPRARRPRSRPRPGCGRGCRSRLVSLDEVRDPVDVAGEPEAHRPEPTADGEVPLVRRLGDEVRVARRRTRGPRRRGSSGPRASGRGSRASTERRSSSPWRDVEGERREAREGAVRGRAVAVVPAGVPRRDLVAAEPGGERSAGRPTIGHVALDEGAPGPSAGVLDGHLRRRRRRDFPAASKFSVMLRASRPEAPVHVHAHAEPDGSEPRAFRGAARRSPSRRRRTSCCAASSSRRDAAAGSSRCR